MSLSEVQIRIRRDTTANWTSANPILTAGEPALDITTGSLRYGDGVTHWLSLPEHAPGAEAGSSEQRVYVQATAPTFASVGTWWDTSGGNLTLWIEDGL